MDSAFNSSEFDNLLDMGVEEILTPEERSGGPRNPDDYAPNYKHENAKDKTYKSRIRLVPNVLKETYAKFAACGLKPHKVSAFKYFFDDIENPGKTFEVICPSNWGDKFNIISNAKFVTKASEIAMIRDLNDKFTRKQYHWALAHIMADVQEPELIGKIKILRFGNQIDDKIASEAKTDPSIQKVGLNVFDPYKGKDLILILNAKTYTTSEGVTYENSYFDSIVNSISLDNGNTRLVKTEENFKEIIEFLQRESPDLSQKLWDKDDWKKNEEKVIDTIRTIIGDEKTFQEIYQKTYSKRGGFSQSSPRTTAPAPERKTNDAPAGDGPKEEPNAQTNTTQGKAVSSEISELEQKVSAKATPVEATSDAPDTTEDFGDINFEELDA